MNSVISNHPMGEELNLANLKRIQQSPRLQLSAITTLEIINHIGLTTKSFNKRIGPLAAAVDSKHIDAVLDEAFAQGLITTKHELNGEPAALHAQDLLLLSDALKTKGFSDNILLRKRRDKLTMDAPEGFTASDMALSRLLLAHEAMHRELARLRYHGDSSESEEVELIAHKSKRRQVEVKIKERARGREVKKRASREAEIRDKYGFVQQCCICMIPKSYGQLPASSGHPQQHVIAMLPKIKDALQHDILHFAKSYVLALEKSYASKKRVRRARELLRIAEEGLESSSIIPRG